MKPFVFRLESVLRYRTFKEKKALAALVAARQGHADIEKKIGSLFYQRQKSAGLRSSRGREGVVAGTYQAYTSFLQKLDRDLLAEKEALDRAAQLVRARESELVVETRKRKTLESLRETQLERHRADIEKKTQQMLDELIINRWETV